MPTPELLRNCERVSPRTLPSGEKSSSVPVLRCNECDAGFEGKVTYQETIEAVRAWMPDEATRHKVFCGNAMKLYFS